MVFDDRNTAARALTELVTHWIRCDSITCEDEAIPAMEVSALETEVPSGRWLVGRTHEKAKVLLLRFAKETDKKKSGAGKFSEYYRRYGNPHYGGKKQLMSGSQAEKLKTMSQMEGGMDDDEEPEARVKRLPVREDSPDSPPRRPLGLRMKMRADDEEEEQSRRKQDEAPADPEGKKSVWDRLEKPSALQRIGSTSRVIQRKKGDSAHVSVWSRLSLPSSATQKPKQSRTVMYSNIRIKK